MRVVGVKRHGASPPRSFSNSDQLLTDVGLWSCGRRTASSKRSGKSTGLLAPYTVGGQRTRFPIEITAQLTVSFRCDPWLEPIYRLRLDARRTSHPVAVSQNGWHHNPSFSRSFGTVRPPGSNGADQALVELA